MNKRACRLAKTRFGWLAGLAALVMVAIIAMPSIVLAQANPVRDLPDEAVQRGETFDVTVTFTAPHDGFHAIGLTDLAPRGWTIEADPTWCDPDANEFTVTDNKVELMWYGPGTGYPAGTSFTAVYNVTVPNDASLGEHTFANGTLEYYYGATGHEIENIAGDSKIEVCAPTLSTSPDPPSHDFGDVPKGQTRSWTFDITNSGCGTLEWTVEASEAWITVDPSIGSTTTETDAVVVRIDTSGLTACNNYEGTITVNSNGGTKVGTIKVHVTIEVVRALPDYGVIKGSPFDVTVTFVAPDNDFHAIGLTDFAPDGWTVEADATWCDPDADEFTVTDNKVELMWYGPGAGYPACTSFTAVYKVSIPEGTSLGTYAFANGSLEYYIGEAGPCTASIAGESDIEAISCATIMGATGEVNCNTLSGVTLTLKKGEEIVDSDISNASGNYELIATEIGDYTVFASKDGFRDETQTISVTELVQEYTLNFLRDHALVPNAPDMSYALLCIHYWKFPTPECGISMSKALSVVHAWKYPL